MALAAYLVLGILVWATIADARIRLLTLAILAMFVVKTWVHRKDTGPVDEGSGADRNPAGVAGAGEVDSGKC
jgi:uncharacterized membrane protein